MTLELIPLLIIGSMFLILFGIGEILYHKFKWKGNDTRKVIHAVTGIITMLFPIYLKSWISVGLLCFSFLMILHFSKRYKIIPSINDIDRKSTGSILYPIIVFIVYCIYTLGYHLETFYIPILILALCDPLAAHIGKKWGKHKIQFVTNVKTYEGSLAFFIGAITISALTMYFCGEMHIACVLTIAIMTTLAELWAWDGWDNLTVPGSALIILYAYGYF
jgi:phytol kinase